MKTTYKLLVLSAILVFLLLFAHVTRAQTTDTIPQWPIVEYRGGFKETHYAFLCVKYNHRDTVSHIYSVYPSKMWFSVNGGAAVKMGRRSVIDVKAEHFMVVVTRKKYERTYQF